MKNWPLNVSQFSILDRIKIVLFFLNPKNRWTQDKFVKKFEAKMAQKIGVKYSVFVSSGSTANTLIAQYVKDTTKNFKYKNIVLFPSTTWQTSCSPWIREGFNPKFIDISLDNFSIDLEKLDLYVKKNYKKIACIFPTSLIGFSPNISYYQYISKKYNIPIYFDNCENTLGSFKLKNISSYFTSSTSTYFGHQIQSVEGGFIFTNSEKEYDYFLMNRNHGMTRGLTIYNRSNIKYLNKKVDSLFDFFSLGNNFRNSDIHAFIGLLDYKRFEDYKKRRISLYNLFKQNLDINKFYLPITREDQEDVPFCLPIILKERNKEKIKKIKDFCKIKNIEYRPIISGFLGYQTCYKKYFLNEKDYLNSLYIHDYGFYIGLHNKVKEKDIIQFTKEINKI